MAFVFMVYISLVVNDVYACDAFPIRWCMEVTAPYDSVIMSKER